MIYLLACLWLIPMLQMSEKEAESMDSEAVLHSLVSTEDTDRLDSAI
jgi:hypothetical protein